LEFPLFCAGGENFKNFGRSLSQKSYFFSAAGENFENFDTQETKINKFEKFIQLHLIKNDYNNYF